MTNLLSFGQTPPKQTSKTPKDITDLQFHQANGHGVDALLMKAMKAQSLDNLSVVMIGLKGLVSALE